MYFCFFKISNKMNQTIKEKALIYAEGIERPKHPGGNILRIIIRQKGKIDEVVIDERVAGYDTHGTINHITSLHRVNLAYRLFRRQMKAQFKSNKSKINHNGE